MARPRKPARCLLLPSWPVDPRSYIDTLIILLPRMMPRDEFTALLASLGDWPAEPTKRIATDKVVYRPDGSWRFLLSVHQPLLETFAILANSSIPLSLFSVHVALDLITPTAADATELRRYVLERLLKNGRPNERIDWYDGTADATAYFSPNLAAGSQIAVYSDKHTKTFRTAPCTHIEWRLRGATELRKNGLGSFGALAMLDHRAFWDERLDLRRAPTIEDLNAAFLRQERGDQKCDSLARERADLLTSLAQQIAFDSHVRAITANDLLHHLNGSQSCSFRAFRMFDKEPHHWMLPPPENSLWR